MSFELSKKLHRLDKYHLKFWCPGCQEAHVIGVRPEAVDNPAWNWNGNVERPTFSPSILIRSGHYAAHYKAGDPCWCTYDKEHQEDPSGFKCVVCHSFVTDGHIQFLGDCTHELVGRTVELPDIPDSGWREAH